MKKILFAVFTIAIFTAAAMAQNADYSGDWKLDVSRSQLNPKAGIESMTLAVKQTEKELTVTKTTKRQQQEGSQGGRGMSLRFGGDGTSVFSLDATDLRSETETPMGAVPVIRNGKKQSDGSLVLSTNITLVTPNGAMTLTTNEHWVLSADGKTLTVKRDLISPRGTTTDTFVYSKS